MQRQLRLWVLPWGLFPRRVTIYLKEKGIEDRIEVLPVQITHNGMEAAPGKPPGTMPILEIRPSTETDRVDGKYIFQSTAILEYLEDVYGPGSGLPDMRGSTPEDRGKMRECMDVLEEGVSFFSFYVHNSSDLMRGRQDQSAQAAKAGMARMHKMFDLLESMASADGPWLASSGAQPLIVDCVFMATVQFALHVYGVDLCEGRPRLGQVYSRFAGRQSAQMVEVPAQIRDLAQRLTVL